MIPKIFQSHVIDNLKVSGNRYKSIQVEIWTRGIDDSSLHQATTPNRPIKYAEHVNIATHEKVKIIDITDVAFQSCYKCISPDPSLCKEVANDGKDVELSISQIQDNTHLTCNAPLPQPQASLSPDSRAPELQIQSLQPTALTTSQSDPLSPATPHLPCPPPQTPKHNAHHRLPQPSSS